MNIRMMGIGAGAVAVTALAIFFVLRPKNELQILGSPPAGVRLVTRADLAPSMPPGYADSDRVSGILYTREAPIWDFGDDGGAHLSMPTGDGWVRCPYVFGKGPRTAEVKLGSGKVSIRLPGSGKEEPALPVASAQAGKWTVRLTPRPWISPGFFVRYKVSLDKGGPPGRKFIEYWGLPDNHGAFAIEDGQTKTISLYGEIPRQQLFFRVFTVRETPLSLYVNQLSDRTKILYGDGSEAYPTHAGWDTQFEAIKIGDWIPRGQGFLGKGTPRALETLRNGEKLDAVGYKQDEVGRCFFILDFPNPGG